MRKWVSFYGFSINVNPDMNEYSGIIPCGIQEYGITSMQELGINTTLSDVARSLQQRFNMINKIEEI